MRLIKCDICGIESETFIVEPTVVDVCCYLGSFDLCCNCKDKVVKEAADLREKHSIEIIKTKESIGIKE